MEEPAKSDKPLDCSTPADSDLGQVILNCRKLSGGQVLISQGFLFGWLLHYVLGPFLLIPGMSMGCAAFILMLVYGQDFDKADLPRGWLALPVAFYLLFIWLFYVNPMGDCLILRVNGIQAHLGFKKLDLEFEEIADILVGRIPSRAESGIHSASSILNPATSNWLRTLSGTAVTLRLKSGRTYVLKAILTRFHSEDLNLFFEYIGKNHPDLVHAL